MANLAQKAFEGCTKLTDVTIESQKIFETMYSQRLTFGDQVTTYILGDSVTYIEDFSFGNCTNLENIVISNSVTYIGSYVFEDCTSLTEITIPNSVKNFGKYPFTGCTALTNVTIESQYIATKELLCLIFGKQVTNYSIGGNVTSIGNRAFSQCTSLTDVNISESVTSIGSGAFEICPNLTKIIIPESVTMIGGNAFNGCTNLPVENNVCYAGDWAVGVADKTQGRYTLKENTRGLASTFSGCSSLVRITFPASLAYISDCAFEGCSSLKSLTLPEGIPSIGNSAFSGCTSLSDINIPSGVVSIGEYAFYDCALTEVSIPKGITEIMSSSFYGNDFSAIEIPEGVTSIGSSAFASCSNLKSVNLPQSLTNIGSSAFRSCSLPSIIIPESVTSIGSSAFTNLESVTLNSPTILSEGGFADKFGDYVTEYIINTDAEEIKDYAFYKNMNLRTVVLPETLTTIGEGAFEECVSLDSITIPANVTEIKDYAFSNCTALKYIACEALVPPTCGTYTFDNVDTENCILEVPASAVNAYATTAPWSEFNKKVSLVDGEDYENETDTEAGVITYTRALNNLLWNALYVPFEIPVSQLIENYDIAYINAMHSYDMDDNGAIDSMVMEVVKIKEGTLHANYPYLIRAKNEEAKAMKIVVENSTLYAAESVTVDCSSVFTKFEITGTYQPLTNEEIAGCYALSGGTWKTMKDDATLNPFRLYMRISDREGSPVKVDTYALEQTSVTIRVQGEEPGTTSIESKEIGVKSEESDATIYNLMGQPVKNPVKGHIYIQGGRKVVW